MNKLFLYGNLTHDPEIRTVNTSAGEVRVCTFTVASNNRQRNSSTFFRVTAWRSLAENCFNYLKKGRAVNVIGSVSARAYQGNDGQIRASPQVNAEEVHFVGRGEDYQEKDETPQRQQAPTAQVPHDWPKEGEGTIIEDPEDLPF